MNSTLSHIDAKSSSSSAVNDCNDEIPAPPPPHSSGGGGGGNGTDPILEDIIDTLDLWMRRILALETDLHRHSLSRQSVNDCIRRQVADGLIDEHTARDLRYTLDLWSDLYKDYNSRRYGADISKAHTLDILLELFSLKQITRAFFIHVAEEL